MFDHLPELLWHALQDTLPLLPWILLIYLLIDLEVKFNLLLISDCTYVFNVTSSTYFLISFKHYPSFFIKYNLFQLNEYL